MASIPLQMQMIVVLGGDGHMPHTMRESIAHGKPLFGMNGGRVGFLMNAFSDDDLLERINTAETAHLHCYGCWQPM